MATHRVTFDLSDSALAVLRSRMESGHYSSENDIVEAALLDLELPDEPLLPQWMQDQFAADIAADEADDHPGYTPEQALEYLEQARAHPATAD